MEFSQDVFRYEELAIMRLRTLYRQYGYEPYRMSRFEEYELYAENRAFLLSDDIIAFTGAGGKLMALRPDVTLSIAKGSKDGDGLKKLYYNENVYRHDGQDFKERMQVGLECMGDIDIDLMSETLMLAARSLEALGKNTRIDVSHMGFMRGLMQSAGVTSAQRAALFQRISEKNVPETRSLCAEYGLDDEFCNKLTALISLFGPFGETIGALRQICTNEDAETAIRELEDILVALQKLGAEDSINLDFSIVNDLGYYSGIIFQGYIEGVPKNVLSGGRYDELLQKLGKKSGAIGFAVYLDLLERHYAEYLTTPSALPAPLPRGELDDGRPPALKPAPFLLEGAMINIALPKGRLGDDAYSIFESAGYGCPAIHEESRRLVFDSPENGVRFFWVKPSDVAIYVERGIADIGIAGKDILLEYSPDLYELLDLGIGKCRMCVAAQKGFSDNHDRTLRVATKFTGIARDYYEKMGREIDIIKLNGSIELAPLMDLSDVIVDLVETGSTLRENNLETVETIAEISARLVANKASYKFKHNEISELCARIEKRGKWKEESGK